MSRWRDCLTTEALGHGVALRYIFCVAPCPSASVVKCLRAGGAA